MTENLGLIVDVEARITKLERGLQKANAIQRKAAKAMEKTAEDNARRIGAHYDGIGDRISGAFGKMGGIAKLAAPIGGAFLGGMAAGGISEIVGNIGQMTKSIANVGSEAKRAGMEVESFQAWSHVAKVNRIEIGALVDGFKELNLRADEFVVTGKGSAAEAFGRLGYGAKDLAEKLKDPDRLMMEIMGKLEGMDKAAQIRIADEIFGGTGGERFVELLGRGQGALQATIDEAYSTGAVLDKELIAKADEIDRAFAALQSRVAGFGKRVVVEIAAGVVALTDFREHLDSLFGNEQAGRQILGDDLYNALDNDAAAAEAARATMEQLRQSYQDLGQQAQMAVPQLLDAAATLDLLEQADAAQALRDAANEMQNLAGEFARGEISADDFATRLVEVERKAQDVFSGLSDVDRASFNGVIGELGRLGGALSSAISLAGSLAGALAAASGGKAVQALRDRHAAEADSMASLDAMRTATDAFTQSEQERNTATSEAIRLEREKAAVRDRATAAGAVLTDAEATAAAQAAIAGEEARAAADAAARKAASGGRGGAGGGGKSSAEKVSEFQREAQAIRDQTQALQTQAAVMLTVAASGKEMGNAIGFAEAKARLLTAAQQSGMAVTPELEKKVDALAQSYAKAGNEAERAGKKMEDANESADKALAAQEKGADAIAGVFMAARQGSEEFANSLRNLADQLLNGVMRQLILGFAQSGLPGSGVVGFLGQGLGGFASGGYTGDGAKYEPAGVVHKSEFVFSREAVANLGVENLERLHQSARSGHRGYASGGLVSGAAKASRASSTPSRASAPVQNISLSPTINLTASGGTPEQNTDLAKQVSGQVEKSLRGLIQDELVRQHRAGGMLRGR